MHHEGPRDCGAKGSRGFSAPWGRWGRHGRTVGACGKDNYRLGQQLIVRTNYVINVIIVLGLNIRNRRFPWTKFPGLNNSNRRFAATRVGP